MGRILDIPGDLLTAGSRLDSISPMLLSESTHPFSHEDWLFELKQDGYRLLAEANAGQVKLKTRNGVDATRWFPEIVAGLAMVPGGPHVIDGEACMQDDIGRSDLGRLQKRVLARRYKPGADPVAYCVFDILVMNGADVMAQPLLERKALLADLLAIRPPSVREVGFVRAEGKWLYQQAVALELRGIVGKLALSAYLPGRRTRDWLKIERPGLVSPRRVRRSRTWLLGHRPRREASGAGIAC